MKKNNNTTATNNSINNKEVITMTNEMIKEMKKLARKYDAFTHCIEDYRQKEEAEKRNETLGVKFVEVANKIGINATANDLYEIISNDYDSFDEAIEAYIKSHEVRVVSETLTQENGELTFVELSPEQKLEISKVLDAQLQDVNYSSWFEEENGIFKLYTAWVDEDPTVEEEYYFDDNKLIKVEVEKEESTMTANNTTNNATINNNTNIKEETTMKKDYTLNGTINATTWQEFRAVMKEAGINTGTKSYAQLVEEYNALSKDNGVTVPVGDLCNDKYYPDCQNDDSDNRVVLDKKHGDYIVKNIVKASFIATKGDSKGQRIVTMHKLFGIIRKAYANGNEQIDEAFIKDIINQLVTLKYICFKKYESGAMIFYPTVKASEYVKNNK